MDKTMAVIIGATAVLVSGMMVLAIFNSNISGLNSDLNSTSERGCEFQVENADDPEDISERCRPEGGVDRFILRNDESVIDAVTGGGSG
ncbi:MAG: hypothetical protein ACI9LV_000349 [Candidatus Nanohaloarchaea archaeon]|jgi:hypothetical protein